MADKTDSEQDPWTGRIEPDATTYAPPSHQSLFKSMSLAGIAWPVSCRNGTYRTCMGRLIQGQVAYDVPWPGLSAEEKIEGHCLPCIARPLTDTVIVRA
jgi:ferredoxin